LKLVLFQRSASTDVLPGLLTERGIVDIAAATPKNYTPQLVMQGIIDHFENLRPALETLAENGSAIPLDQAFCRALEKFLPASRTTGNTPNASLVRSMCS
jgi:hypothetical protein